MGFVNSNQKEINGWAYTVNNSKYYQIQVDEKPRTKNRSRRNIYEERVFRELI